MSRFALRNQILTEERDRAMREVQELKRNAVNNPNDTEKVKRLTMENAKLVGRLEKVTLQRNQLHECLVRHHEKEGLIDICDKCGTIYRGNEREKAEKCCKST